MKQFIIGLTIAILACLSIEVWQLSSPVPDVNAVKFFAFLTLALLAILSLLVYERCFIARNGPAEPYNEEEVN